MRIIRDSKLALFALVSGYVILTYIPFYFLSNQRMFPLIRENGFFQTLTAIAFLVASFYLLRTYFRFNNGNDFHLVQTRRNVFVLLLALVFFIGAGEELSWGQHMLGFEPPEFFAEHNRQGEFNIHNLVPVAGRYADGTPKTGIDEYLTIGQAFSVFWFGFCVLIPLLALTSTKGRQFLLKLNMPIVPLWIGMVFPVNHILSKFVVATTDARGHYVVEVKESNFGILFALFAITLFFHLKNVSQNEDNLTPESNSHP